METNELRLCLFEIIDLLREINGKLDTQDAIAPTNTIRESKEIGSDKTLPDAHSPQTKPKSDVRYQNENFKPSQEVRDEVHSLSENHLESNQTIADAKLVSKGQPGDNNSELEIKKLERLEQDYELTEEAKERLKRLKIPKHNAETNKEVRT